MSKVLITRSKLDGLATTIAAKSGATLPLTIAQMDAAVEGIETGGNDLIVTLSYNESTEMWEPDKTYAEIQAAHEAGKTIAVEATPNGSGDTPSVMGEWTPLGGGAFAYTIAEQHYSSVSGDSDGTIEKNYFLTTNGIVNPLNRNLWLTEDATATPSDVLSGKVFYGADGQHTGTATTPTPTLQSKSVSYTPSETAQSATVTADSGYDGLSSVDVSVGAISSTYVGSGITQRSSSDLTASGATVTVPAGYYSAQASKAVASGTAGFPTVTKGERHRDEIIVSSSVTNTAGYIDGGTIDGDSAIVSLYDFIEGTYTIDSAGEHDVAFYEWATVAAGTAGTPTATKGTVSNHSVSIIPSVTNTTGYIEGGTKSGTAVTVAASELVSGTYTVGASGTHDVTNYASASVAAGGATASATKGTVSNHSVTVTPSVTRTAGYVTAGTANGTAVTVSASELVSGSETKTENGTYDVTNLASLIVDVDGYTLTTVCPQQTITPNSDRVATPVGSFDYEVGEFYLVTFDGVQYVTSCALCWDTNHVIGDTRVIWGDAVTVAPFCSITVGTNDKAIYCLDTSTHTIKVEHLELGTPAATLTTKSITANGTYNASSDNADGYSSVTVAIPIVTYHTSSSAPTSSQGSDGDLWLVTA